MKSMLKVSLVLFIGVSIIVFLLVKKRRCVRSQDALIRCQRQMYNPYANSDDGSCVSFIYGCMDDLAINYVYIATADDSTCLYAYDLVLGVWDIDPDCEEIDILGQVVLLNDQLPESIDVQV